MDSSGSEGGGRDGEAQEILSETHPPFSRISYDPAILPAPFPPPPSFLATYKSLHTVCLYSTTAALEGADMNPLLCFRGFPDEDGHGRLPMFAAVHLTL